MGILFINDVYTCATLENADKIIPTGFYHVRLTMSPKFGEILPLLDHVPGRDGIRIHPGNTAKDSSGCILVGLDDKPAQLRQSRKTFNALREQLLEAVQQREDIYIDIQDCSTIRLLQNRVYDHATQYGTIDESYQLVHVLDSDKSSDSAMTDHVINY